MEIVRSEMANALTSADSNHVIAVAADVYDEALGTYQSDINDHLAKGEVLVGGSWKPNVGASVEADGETIVNTNGVLSVAEDLRDSMQAVNDISSEILTQYNLVNTVTGADELKPFDENSIYMPGDICLYPVNEDGTVKEETLLYRFVKEKLRGPWQPSSVKETTLIKELTPDQYEVVQIKILGIPFADDLSKIKVIYHEEGTSDYIEYSVNNEGYAVTTSGETELHIPKGTEYSVAFSELEGYKSVPGQTIVASISYRLVVAQYFRSGTSEETITHENLRIVVSGLKSDYYEFVNITIDCAEDNTFTSYNLVTDKAEGDTANAITVPVPLGKKVSITFTDMSQYGYVNPTPIRHTPSIPKATVIGKFAEVVQGIWGYDENWDVVEMSNTSSEEALKSIKFIAFSFIESGAGEDGRSFMISVNDIITVGNYSMCNENIAFNSSTQVISNNKYDGEGSTKAILVDVQTAASSSGRNIYSPACNLATSKVLTIEGTPYTGYIPSEQQLILVISNKDILNWFWNIIVPNQKFPYTETDFWSSTQYNDSQMRVLLNGVWYSRVKNNGNAKPAIFYKLYTPSL